MPKLKPLSGDELLRIFARFGFIKFSQRGSHVKLRRQVASGSRQTLTIPLHREVDKGTPHAILRQAQRYLTEEELAPHVFVE